MFLYSNCFRYLYKVSLIFSLVPTSGGIFWWRRCYKNGHCTNWICEFYVELRKSRPSVFIYFILFFIFFSNFKIFGLFLHIVKQMLTVYTATLNIYMPTWDEYIALRLPSGNNSSLGGLYNQCCPQITWYFYNHHFIFFKYFYFLTKFCGFLWFWSLF